MARSRSFAEARFVRASKFDTTSEDEAPTEIVIDVPEDLSSLDDDALAALIEDASEAFDAIAPEDDSAITADDLTAMERLVDTLESLRAERDSREEAARERAERAAALRDRIAPAQSGEEVEAETAEATETTKETGAEEGGEEVVAEAEAVTREAVEEIVTAGTSGPIVVQGRRRPPRSRDPLDGEATAGRRVVFRGAGGTRQDGMALDAHSLGQRVAKTLGAIPKAQVEAGKRTSGSFRQEMGVGTLRRSEQVGHDPSLVIDTTDPAKIVEIIDRAADPARLPGGSLTAAGWCSPSEVLNEQFDCGLSPGAGLLSLPEVTVEGGITYQPGISYSSIAAAYSGFNFDETEAVAGDFANEGNASDKPCYEIDCGTWDEVRQHVAGICLTGDILQQRTNPERAARITDIALAVHMRRLSDLRIAAMQAGSTTVTAPSTQAGAVAPILSFVELQAAWMRNHANLSESVTLEGVWPDWVKGAMRADFARRHGVDLVDVPDSRLEAHFAQRGVRNQYVYGWQALDSGSPGTPPTTYPTSVTGLMYPAGTWVSGVTDIITLDTIYDSELLKRNKYVGLFTEEGWSVFNRGCDSLEVVVNIEPDGATHGGIDIAADGTIVPAA